MVNRSCGVGAGKRRGSGGALRGMRPRSRVERGIKGMGMHVSGRGGVRHPGTALNPCTEAGGRGCSETTPRSAPRPQATVLFPRALLLQCHPGAYYCKRYPEMLKPILTGGLGAYASDAGAHDGPYPRGIITAVA